MGFPFYKQPDSMDCGPTCLRMIAKYYGKHYTLPYLRNLALLSREGVSLLGISKAAEQIGLRTLGVKVTDLQLYEEAPLPCIAHWKQNHFVVVHKITRNHVYVADPGNGLIRYNKQEFLSAWASDSLNGHPAGILLLLETTPAFYEREDEGDAQKRTWGVLFRYVWQYKAYFLQLLLGLLIGSGLQLIFPFVTQSVVDVGISGKDVHFVYLMLIAQLVLFGSRTIVEALRAWIMLHISTRINISIISDFLIKLMRLPIRFFDTKNMGDIMQRIGDHSRIEHFLTGQTFNTLFSLFNLLVFSTVLLLYSSTLFIVFFIGSIIYVLWIVMFMKYRKALDMKNFALMSQNQNNLYQLITGMQEIKMNNLETQKRWEWERIQARLFKQNVKRLTLDQIQQIGSGFLNEGKNIFITFITVQEVMQGSITLGMMMSVSYIIGQMNSPIIQFISFLQSAQDAQISMERMSEIHNQPDEEPENQMSISILPENGDINLQNVRFSYPGPEDIPVIKDLDLHIPKGKITAIVGTSGSGKTTLLKLLLKSYPPTKGKVMIGGMDLAYLHSALWRDQCGVVMQEGFIFSDTIANNIALKEPVDTNQLLHAVKTANIQEHIESLPLGYNTKIGAEGMGLSQGQKQRLLIARAVYKNPQYLFFDEATNALDANNEHIIMHNLSQFFQGRTVVVVAHRLSTVKNADQIIVLEKGKIIEVGNHASLIAQKGSYFELVKNQLELGD